MQDNPYNNRNNSLAKTVSMFILEMVCYAKESHIRLRLVDIAGKEYE